MPRESMFDIARRQAAAMIEAHLDAFSPIASLSSAGSRSFDAFADTIRRYPPAPAVFDLRRGEPAKMKQADLSHLRPGDAIETPGASIRIDDHGAPITILRPAFDNGRAAGRSGPILVPPGPEGVSVDDNIAMATGKTPFWFRRTVPKGGPWDYKQLAPKYEAFGNFNYGATGREIGFPTSILDQEAGRAQIRDHTSQPSWGQPGPHLAPMLGTGSYGDDPVDQFWIEEGARYHEKR